MHENYQVKCVQLEGIKYSAHNLYNLYNLYIDPVGQIYCMVVTCLDVCIIYFISCDCIMNSPLYNILKIAELDCCQIIILSIYVPSTQA